MTQSLDLRGLKCPLPVLRTRKELENLAPGAELTVLCTDPLSALDIPHLLQETGYELVRQGQEGEVLVFVVRRKN